VSADPLVEQARRYYDAALRTHGVSPRGVDWNSAESQELRFERLATVLAGDVSAAVLDYGCGYGALAVYLRSRGHQGAYQGFDVSDDMIAAARSATAEVGRCALTSDRSSLTTADFTLASGVFNVRGSVSDDDWYAYLLRTLHDIRALSRCGFAFNALTTYSDLPKRRADLYYADPLALFDYCQRTFSRRVALLHDYPLYEFTLSIRL
jgi:SAM-dependent methyltransferase